MWSRKKTGFTLIELLVVIAVIGILAAMIFPVFARARATARKAVCLSSQKQIMLGIMMYADDWDETYCPNSITTFGGVRAYPAGYKGVYTG